MQRRCLNGPRYEGFFSMPSARALLWRYLVFSDYDQEGIRPQWRKAYSCWPGRVKSEWPGCLGMVLCCSFQSEAVLEDAMIRSQIDHCQIKRIDRTWLVGMVMPRMGEFYGAQASCMNILFLYNYESINSSRRKVPYREGLSGGSRKMRRCRDDGQK